MGLPYGEKFIILTSTVFLWYTHLTDGQTDRRTDGRAIAYTRYSISPVKMMTKRIKLTIRETQLLRRWRSARPVTGRHFHRVSLLCVRFATGWQMNVTLASRWQRMSACRSRYSSKPSCVWCMQFWLFIIANRTNTRIILFAKEVVYLLQTPWCTIVQ